MATKKQGPLTFNDGYVFSRERIYVASQERAEAKSDRSMVAIVIDQQWKLASLDDAALSVACDDQRHGFFLGHYGRVLVSGAGGRTVEQIPYSDELGELLRIRNVNGTIYVCGMSGQVFRRVANGWAAIDGNIRGTDQLDFEDIGGTGPSNLYAVTSFGAVMHYDGRKWRSIDFPGNRPLSGIRARNPQEVYVCGDDGGLYRGHADRWDFIGSSDLEFDYWSVELYADDVYVAHGGGLVRFDGRDLHEVELGIDGEIDCHRLHANDGVLFSFGVDHILCFDGGRWSRFLCPFNEQPA